MSSSTLADTASSALAEFLFAKDDTPIFAVLDGASAPNLLKSLYEHKPEYCCLYRGELQPDIATVAPYLVRLEPRAEFAQLILREGWGAHWGIFIVSADNLRVLRNHLREFHTVELPDRRSVLFRYYDPRVLRSFLPACNAAELGTFFGPVQNFVVEGDTPETGFRFSLAGQALKSEPLQIRKTL